jgi:serine/threonine-protein kinase
VDLGESERESLLQTAAGTLVGTPAYMSPEQNRGEPVDARSDLYSVCVVLYELLTLSHPLADCRDLPTMTAALQTRRTPMAWEAASPHQPPVAADLSWFLEKGLRKDKAERYQEAREMLDRLARRAEGDIPVQCPVTFSRSLALRLLRFIDQNKRATVVGLSILGGSLVAVVVAGVWALITVMG